MKISQITAEDVATFLRLEEGDYREAELSAMMEVATSYLAGATAISQTELDNYPDFWLAFMVLMQDMYCNRTKTVDKANVNQTVEDIIAMHRRNLV